MLEYNYIILLMIVMRYMKKIEFHFWLTSLLFINIYFSFITKKNEMNESIKLYTKINKCN